MSVSVPRITSYKCYINPDYPKNSSIRFISVNKKDLHFSIHCKEESISSLFTALLSLKNEISHTVEHVLSVSNVTSFIKVLDKLKEDQLISDLFHQTVNTHIQTLIHQSDDE